MARSFLRFYGPHLRLEKNNLANIQPILTSRLVNNAYICPLLIANRIFFMMDVLLKLRQKPENCNPNKILLYIETTDQENSTEINSFNLKLYGKRNTRLRAIATPTSQQITLTTLKTTFCLYLQ